MKGITATWGKFTVPIESSDAARTGLVSRRAVAAAGLSLPVIGALSMPEAQAAGVVTRWINAPYATVWPTTSTTRGAFSRLGEAVPVTGTYVGSAWFRISSGAMAGRFLQSSALTTRNPATQSFAYPSPDPFSLPRVGSRLTRYVISGDFSVNTRASASFGAATRAQIAPRARVTGVLVSPDWMRLDDGRYLSTALLATTPTVRAFNGRLPGSRLRALPGYLNTPSISGTRTLARIAADQFVRMDAAYHSATGGRITVNEGYRPLAWQKYWYSRYGAPRAAYPGTSNHGSGLAVDIRSDGSSPFAFGRTGDRWLTANATRFGFDRPWWLDAGHGNAEFWHYNFVG